MGDVIQLDMQTILDVPVENVIRGAIKANLSEIIVIGRDVNGEFYFAASKSDAANICWELERAKHELMIKVHG